MGKRKSAEALGERYLKEAPTGYYDLLKLAEEARLARLEAEKENHNEQKTEKVENILSAKNAPAFFNSPKKPVEPPLKVGDSWSRVNPFNYLTDSMARIALAENYLKLRR
jgi:hypothetical protein